VNGYWNAAARRCETCPAGTISSGGAVATCASDRCPPETARGPDGRCLPCDAGTHSAGGEAAICDAAPCSVDQLWDPIRGLCAACGAGRSSAGGFSAACFSDCAPNGWGTAALLAGDRTQPERSVDGSGRAARFADIGRLRWDAYGRRLVAYDGALRAIALDGTVSTVVTSSDLSSCNLGESAFDVDVAGGIAWFCAGTSSLTRRESDGRVVSFPVAWPVERFVRALAAAPSGGIVVGWSTRVCQDVGGACWKAGLSRLGRDGAVTDLWTSDARADLGGMSDLVVTGDGRVLVIDPEADVVHVIDPGKGREGLLVDALGATVPAAGRHAVADAAGRLFLGGRVIDPAGSTVAVFPTTDAGDAVALVGADDDLVRSVCTGAGALRRCELVFQTAVCAP
jgi:hypothetical protein